MIRKYKRQWQIFWTATIVFVVLGVLAGIANAEGVESHYVDSAGYSTVDGAAIAALALAMKRTNQYGFEFGGVIFEYDGSFYYTDPVTSGHKHKVDYVAYVPNSGEIAATFHTHPTSDGFSRADIATAKKLRTVAYLGVGDTIKKLDPAERGARAEYVARLTR